MRLRIKDILTKNKLAIILFLIAIFLRLYRFAEFTTFLGDQGRDAIIIKRIITFEHFPAIGPSSSVGGVFLGPFFYYLIAPFLWLFNFNPLGLAFSSAFFSILGLVASYFIIARFINNKTALIFTVLLAFSNAQIYFSRFSWNPNLLPVFSFFTLFFFYQLLTKKNLIYPLLFGAFLSFSIQLHYLAILLFLPIIVFYLLKIINSEDILYEQSPGPRLLSKGKSGEAMRKGYRAIVNILKNIQNDLIKIAILCLSFLITFSPLIIFDLKHDFINSRSFLKSITVSTSTHNPFTSRFLETLTSFFTQVAQAQFNQSLAIIIFLALP